METGRRHGTSLPPPDNAAALAGLDAIVIDCETTGLDPAKAWMVEFAFVPLVRGSLDPSSSFSTLINPGTLIPPAASKIHGIDDAAVADAPPFLAIAPKLATALGGTVLIGHSLGFDLAVLRREFARAKVEWRPLRTLDTRLLAEIAAPGLAGYSLESLCAWLGVELGRRHSAPADAETTARIFLALVPKLREAGVRTLAEAERRCRSMAPALDRQHRAGWAEPVQSASGALAPERIDSFPYRYRVFDVMSAPALFAASDTPLSEVLQRMMRTRVSSLFVHSGGGEVPARADEAGIVTERDVLRAIAAGGVEALSRRAADIASRPLETVLADAFCYLAIARMNRRGIRHLGVTDASGFLAGALSARDLLRLRAEGAISLGDEIEEAANVVDLVRAWARLPGVSSALSADGASGREIAAVISRQLCALTARASVFAEERMREAGQGGPPCDYAFAVLGSAGRGESLLAMDQDNALVFAEGEPGGPEDAWFARLASQIADILHEAGVPYCQGGIMARNPQWRGSAATWRGRISRWITRSNPDDLLAVDIFFDMQGVHGDRNLADAIWREAFEFAKDQPAFAKLLADSAGSIEPGLTLFRRFRTTQGRLNLKKTGLFGLVGTARALAIRHHVVERSTPSRLSGLKASGIGASADLDSLLEAQGTFLDLILKQQVEDVAQGIPPSNAIVVRRLSRMDRERLLFALEAVGVLRELTRDLLY